MTSLTVTRAAVGAVPEPAAWVMMIVGLGGLGASLRRTRRSAARPPCMGLTRRG